MRSLTKRRLSEKDIEALARQALGVGVDRIEELTDGWFSAAYAVSLADGRDAVLKVAPAPEVPLLTYESDLMHAEMLYYRVAASVGMPVPPVYAVDLSGTALSSHYAFTGRLPGGPLDKAANPPGGPAEAALRGELGRQVARVHGAGGPFFGYPRRDGRTRSDRWRVSFLSMVDDILDDAVRLGADLGAPAGVVRALLHRHAPVLDEVRVPALVHFDLWDGNVFVDGSTRLTGVIDGERAFYGDPYAEFVSLALFRDIEDVPGLLAGYAAGAGRPVSLDAATRIRLGLYTGYLYLIMLTEGPTRGYAGPEHESLLARVRTRLDAVLTALGAR